MQVHILGDLLGDTVIFGDGREAVLLTAIKIINLIKYHIWKKNIRLKLMQEMILLTIATNSFRIFVFFTNSSSTHKM